MSDFKVNFSTLAGAATDIQSGATQLESALNDMDTQLKPLQAQWTGDSASAYLSAKAKWTSAISDMKMLLTEIGSAVSSSGDSYKSMEQSNTNLWSR